ncbi:MAG: hypothetical protein IJP43_09700 [Oscillospiraceae bacterium]|nr:hypothetical protein [Oscillospiraceae bacterium]
MANDLTISDVVIDVPKTLGRNVLAVASEPSREYIDGKPSDTISAYRYTLVLADKAYKAITVKVPGTEHIEIAPGEVVPVFVEGLTIRPYISNSGSRPSIMLSATANSVRKADNKG